MVDMEDELELDPIEKELFELYEVMEIIRPYPRNANDLQGVDMLLVSDVIRRIGELLPQVQSNMVLHS